MSNNRRCKYCETGYPYYDSSCPKCGLDWNGDPRDIPIPKHMFQRTYATIEMLLGAAITEKLWRTLSYDDFEGVAHHLVSLVRMAWTRSEFIYHAMYVTDTKMPKVYDRWELHNVLGVQTGAGFEVLQLREPRREDPGVSNSQEELSGMPILPGVGEESVDVCRRLRQTEGLEVHEPGESSGTTEEISGEPPGIREGIHEEMEGEQS
jgi:hypothetical protein